MSEERLKIAVFVDFDNIEIGVKKTLSRHFDIGTVLEAIKERGEVVTKIAYGDWKHAADYSRAMTQHAVHMVQRNLTPGGDKNGADITLALDALEMAFTRSHINAFVIVGGDSDFIALVEKLKQYDKMVFVVGGRSFTSTILQKNCHEFIAYENLIGIQPVVRKAAGRAPAVSTQQLRDALPQLRRALEVLADREVSPQLGLLKSTLLQLDSTFSERDYGAHSFREFIQMMANAGYVRLKQVDRSLIVELQDGEEEPAAAAAPVRPEHDLEPVPAVRSEPAAPSKAQPHPPAKEAQGTPLQAGEAVAAVRQILEQTATKAHWPMYLRTFRHFLRSGDPAFDERRFGISNIHDLARLVQREGVLRIERNRQGILRLFPGEQMPQATQAAPSPPEETTPAEGMMLTPVEPATAEVFPVSESPLEIVAAGMVAEISAAEPVREEPSAEERAAPEAAAEGKPKRKKTGKPAGSSRQKKNPQKRSAKSPKKAPSAG